MLDDTAALHGRSAPSRQSLETVAIGRGTESSNPLPSRGESTNHRFRRRFHGLEITKEKQRVSEALARVDAQREKRFRVPPR